MLKPLGDKIVVKPLERIKSNVIAVVMDEQDNMGTVVAVGPGKKLSADQREVMPVEVGQFVRHEPVVRILPKIRDETGRT